MVTGTIIFNIKKGSKEMSKYYKVKFLVGDDKLATIPNVTSDELMEVVKSVFDMSSSIITVAVYKDVDYIGFYNKELEFTLA